MGGPPTINTPSPSKEERLLQKEQVELLRLSKDTLLKQQKDFKLFMPIFAKQMGLQLGIDKGGTLRWIKELPETIKQRELQEQIQEQTLQDLLKTPEERAEYKEFEAQQRELFGLQLQEQKDRMTGPDADRRNAIERLLQQRTLKALRGELEVDPALERNIKEQGTTLRDRLRQQLGSGYETSTPGMEALQRFDESANVLRSEARRGELTLSEQLSAARTGTDLALGSFGSSLQQSRIPGIDPFSAGGFAFGAGQGGLAQQQQVQNLIASPLGIAGGLGQVAGGFQMPIGTMQQDRNMQQNAAIQNANNSMSFMGGVGSMFGSIFSAMPFASDEYNKVVLGKISETDDGMGIYIYQREGEDAKLGVIAQDVLLHRPHAVVEGSDGVLRIYREAL